VLVVRDLNRDADLIAGAYRDLSWRRAAGAQPVHVDTFAQARIV
jgi:hypothetical protein